MGCTGAQLGCTYVSTVGRKEALHDTDKRRQTQMGSVYLIMDEQPLLGVFREHLMVLRGCILAQLLEFLLAVVILLASRAGGKVWDFFLVSGYPCNLD